MAVYQAPDIKDRIAVGDDLYQIADSGGKKKLTPDPTEVTEAGTPIDKALLQPMADAIERIDTDLVPYTLYWWRRRPTSGSYVETRQKATGTSIHHVGSSDSKTYYYLCAKRSTKTDGASSWDDEYATLKYSSSISINQSTGAISLVNPSSYVFEESTNVSSSSVYGRFQGKYVQGFLNEGNNIFYIPNTERMNSHSWESSNGDAWTEYGYEFTADDTYCPMRVNAAKQTTYGSWEPISSDSGDTYPKSGTSGGYDWKYLGRISEAVSAPIESAFDGVITIPITSASWSSSGSSYALNVTIPCKRYYLVISGDVSSGVIGIVDNGKFTGLYFYRKDITTSAQTKLAVNSTSLSSYGVSITSTGLSFLWSSTDAFTIGYMSLDK